MIEAPKSQNEYIDVLSVLDRANSQCAARVARGDVGVPNRVAENETAQC